MRKIFNQAKFLPWSYGNEENFDYDLVKGEEVFILDFSFKRETMIKIKSLSKSVLCLDHHKTAEKELIGLDYCQFDLTKSGARLTLDWIKINHKEDFSNSLRPYFANVITDYVEDHDLWNHILQDSKEINAALQSYDYDFLVWDRLPDIEEMILQGKGIRRFKDKLVKEHVSRAKEVTIPKLGKCKGVYCSSKELVSDIGNILSQNQPFACTWFDNNGKRHYSLRSSKDGLDVGELAKQIGGGGHFHAAGVSIKLNE